MIPLSLRLCRTFFVGQCKVSDISLSCNLFDGFLAVTDPSFFYFSNLLARLCRCHSIQTHVAVRCCRSLWRLRRQLSPRGCWKIPYPWAVRFWWYCLPSRPQRCPSDPQFQSCWSWCRGSSSDRCIRSWRIARHGQNDGWESLTGLWHPLYVSGPSPEPPSGIEFPMLRQRCNRQSPCCNNL